MTFSTSFKVSRTTTGRNTALKSQEQIVVSITFCQHRVGYHRVDDVAHVNRRIISISSCAGPCSICRPDHVPSSVCLRISDGTDSMHMRGGTCVMTGGISCLTAGSCGFIHNASAIRPRHRYQDACCEVIASRVPYIFSCLGDSAVPRERCNGGSLGQARAPVGEYAQCQLLADEDHQFIVIIGYPALCFTTSLASVCISYVQSSGPITCAPMFHVTQHQSRSVAVSIHRRFRLEREWYAPLYVIQFVALPPTVHISFRYIVCAML